MGLLAWKGPSFLQPITIAIWGIAIAAAGSLFFLRKGVSETALTSCERRVIALLLLLAVIALSKATYSVGPVGELYLGQISRSLEVGARSDSRINYHVVQMVAARDHAYGPIVSRLLAPWNFSHRGPLAGLAASVTVLGTRARPSITFPDSPWQIFDREGFAAYRAAMIVMACCLLWPVFALLRLFLPELQALLGFLVVAGSPFIIHELYFTWPKSMAAGLVVMSAGLAWQKRYLLSGLLLGLAYLVHPSALLATPAILAFPLLHLSSTPDVLRQGPTVLAAMARQVAGAAIFILLWRAVNGRRYSQGGFLDYFRMAYNLPPTLQNWLAVRWLSLRNTVIPLHLYFFDRLNDSIVLSGVPPAILIFFIQYWTSLPSGVGLVLYPCLLYWLILAWKYARAWLVFIVFVPLLVFTLYWGAFTTGLLREGLHAWVLGVLCLGAWCWLTHGAKAHGWWRYTSWALLLRGIETIAMLILPGIVTQRRLINDTFAITDVISLALLLAGCTTLYVLTFRLSESLRRMQA
jgi:hypothetical protein